jgi:predicted site-specific integrase-resolvase
MKLSAWAKLNGLTYKTAWRMWKAGKLPIPAEQLPTGTVLVHPPGANAFDGVALYARVSSSDQRADLDRQLARLAEYAARNGLHVIETAQEVGSGLNDPRRVLLQVLRNPKVQTIVVEHRDRLMRFGFEYVEAALAAQGRRVLVIEPEGVADDLVQDVHALLVSMCARLSDPRSAAKRAQNAIHALHHE